MALFSQMIRSVAITGSTDYVNAWYADSQSSRWAEQRMRAAFPNAKSSGPPPPADRAGSLHELNELRRRGVVTDAEFARLRARLGV